MPFLPSFCHFPVAYLFPLFIFLFPDSLHPLPHSSFLHCFIVDLSACPISSPGFFLYLPLTSLLSLPALCMFLFPVLYSSLPWELLVLLLFAVSLFFSRKCHWNMGQFLSAQWCCRPDPLCLNSHFCFSVHSFLLLIPLKCEIYCSAKILE